MKHNKNRDLNFSLQNSEGQFEMGTNVPLPEFCEGLRLIKLYKNGSSLPNFYSKIISHSKTRI